MGPNVLWLTEALTQKMNLKPGMRVLDMGCGMAASSIFLAKEFRVQVWATDLWISASDNWKRVEEAGLQNQIFPIHAEAHTLPFADNFFDAAVSMDSYHYFGTNDLYLGYYLKFVRSGGEVGIVAPGVREEFTHVPEHLKPYWGSESWSFHSPTWWKHHWSKADLLEVACADMIEDGWKHWRDWNLICKDQEYGFYQPDIDMLDADEGRNLGFTRVVGVKK
jgi:cyclopropane fatty-acyl-phospholipid synthase-like methyltransferase